MLCISLALTIPLPFKGEQTESTVFAYTSSYLAPRWSNVSVTRTGNYEIYQWRFGRYSSNENITIHLVESKIRKSSSLSFLSPSLGFSGCGSVARRHMTMQSTDETIATCVTRATKLSKYTVRLSRFVGCNSGLSPRLARLSLTLSIHWGFLYVDRKENTRLSGGPSLLEYTIYCTWNTNICTDDKPWKLVYSFDLDDGGILVPSNLCQIVRDSSSIQQVIFRAGVYIVILDFYARSQKFPFDWSSIFGYDQYICRRRMWFPIKLIPGQTYVTLFLHLYFISLFFRSVIFQTNAPSLLGHRGDSIYTYIYIYIYIHIYFFNEF